MSVAFTLLARPQTIAVTRDMQPALFSDAKVNGRRIGKI